MFRKMDIPVRRFLMLNIDVALELTNEQHT